MDETVREIKSKGGSAYSYECDVSSCDDVKQAAAKVREDMQTVDILMNNAGVMCLNAFTCSCDECFNNTKY